MKYIALERLGFKEDAKEITEISTFSGINFVTVKSQNKTLTLFFSSDRCAEIAYERLKDFLEFGKDGQTLSLEESFGLEKAELEAEVCF